MRGFSQGRNRSVARLATRERYRDYMRSSGWFATRDRWEREWHQRNLGPVRCAVCRCEWEARRDDLHHRSYDRFGHEAFDDLVPMCRACHSELHRIIDTSRTWRRMHRALATDLVLTKMREMPRPRPPKPQKGRAE